MANENNNDAIGRIYLVIPVKYRCTYNRLLTALSDFGIDALKDCDSVCKGSKGQVIKCWNMFQAAMAAYELGNEREADVLIKYIDAQLNIIYKDGAPSENCPNITCCDYQVILELLKADFKDLMLEALDEYFGGGPTPPTPTTKYTITVNVTPSNANVTINGQNTKVLEVNAGSDVVINASLTGYESRTINLTNVSFNQDIPIVLQQIIVEKATLNIIPTPSNASVTMNGYNTSSLEVDAGSDVTVEVFAEGYIAQTFVVNNVRGVMNRTVILQEQPPTPQPVYNFSVNGRNNDSGLLIEDSGDDVDISYYSTVTDEGITSNVPVDIELQDSSISWVHLTEENGSVNVVIDENQSTSSRTAVIIFTQNDSENVIRVTITQSGTVPEANALKVKYNETYFSPDGSLTKLTFDASGGTKRLDIESNTNWNID